MTFLSLLYSFISFGVKASQVLTYTSDEIIRALCDKSGQAHLVLTEIDLSKILVVNLLKRRQKQASLFLVFNLMKG